MAAGDLYAILGVASDATEEEIKRAYFRGVKEHSPEKDPEQFKLIRAAYETLSDPSARHDYDTLQAYGGEIEALNEEAEEFIELEDWDEAARCYKRILVLQPESNAARNSLGLCYMQAEKYEDAVKTFAQLVKQSPESVAYWMNLGFAHMHEADEHTERSTTWRAALTKAQEAFHKATLLDPVNSDARQGVAAVRRQFKDWDGAAVWLEAAIVADGTTDLHDIDALIGLCFVYVIKDDRKKLAETLQRLVDITPESTEAREYIAARLDVLGSQMGEAGRFAEAAIAFEHALKLDPDDEDLIRARDYAVHVERAHAELLRLKEDNHVVPPLKFFAVAALANAYGEEPSTEEGERAAAALSTYPTRRVSASLARMESVYPSLYWLNSDWFDYLSERLGRVKKPHPSAEGAVVPAAARTQQPPRVAKPPRRKRGLVIVAVVAAVLLAIIGLGSARGESSPEPQPIMASSATPTPAPSVSLDDAVLLRMYFSELDGPFTVQSWRVSWEWADGGSHRGTLFGPRVAVEYRSDGSTWWLDNRARVREIASGFETESMDLAAIEAPKALRSEHDKLVRAVRIESRRWRRFDAVVRRSGDAQWAALLEWEKWSKAAFKTQKRYLDDWAFGMRAEARKQGVPMRAVVKAYVQRVEKLVR